MSRPGTLLTAAAQDDPELRDLYLRQEEAIHAAVVVAAIYEAVTVRDVISKFLEVMNEPLAAPPSHARVEANRDHLARELFQQWQIVHEDRCGCAMQYLDECSHRPPIALRDWLLVHVPHAGDLVALPTPPTGARGFEAA